MTASTAPNATCPVLGTSDHVVVWEPVTLPAPEPGVGDAVMFGDVPERGACMACGHEFMRDGEGSASLLR